MKCFCRKGSGLPPHGRPSLDDYEFLHTLCTVWPHGPEAQAFLKNPTSDYAKGAAIEVRKAIEGSFYATYELGQDHIELLQRIEFASIGDLSFLVVGLDPHEDRE